MKGTILTRGAAAAPRGLREIPGADPRPRCASVAQQPTQRRAPSTGVGGVCAAPKPWCRSGRAREVGQCGRHSPADAKVAALGASFSNLGPRHSRSRAGAWQSAVVEQLPPGVRGSGARPCLVAAGRGIRGYVRSGSPRPSRRVRRPLTCGWQMQCSGPRARGAAPRLARRGARANRGRGPSAARVPERGESVVGGSSRRLRRAPFAKRGKQRWLHCSWVLCVFKW